MIKIKSLSKITSEKYNTFQLWTQYLFRQIPSFICAFIFFAQVYHLIPNSVVSFLPCSCRNLDFGLEGKLQGGGNSDCFVHNHILNA